jgi:hypothetical protein
MPELENVANDLSRILKENFVGFYIMGSFVMGDWNPRSSDIDFIAVTMKRLSRRESLEIGKLHQSLSKSDLGKKLEGVYAYLKQLQQKRFEERTGCVENGEFKADRPCPLSADSVLCLLKYGKRIQGLPIEELGLSVSREELSNAVYGMLLEDAEEIGKKEDFQSLYYVLIDMLRCIYTLETGELPTKSRALEYCMDLAGRGLYENVKAFREGRIEEFRIEKSDLDRIACYGLSRKNMTW